MPFMMTLPEPRPAAPLPSRAQPRRNRPARFVLVLAILALVGGAGAGGYYVGVSSREVPIWDPLWVRAYLQRPVDLSAPQQGPWVAGYYVDYDRDSLRTLEVRSPHVDQVIAFSYNITADGSITGKDPKVLLGISRPSKLVLLFANDQFSPAIADAVLQSPDVRQRAIDGILAKAEAFDASGVQIDFEGVPKERRAELTQFIADLARAVQSRGRTLSMAVPAKTWDSPQNDWNGAFDYRALGLHLDQIYIMAYDEHWRGGPPGPVASLPWVEQVIRYAISVIPTEKIVLGIPGYGYDWGPAGARAFGSRFMAERLKTLGAEQEWDPIMGEVVARYQKDGETHVVWYPDERSLEAKIRLARQYNLRGIALWRLGFESGETWTQMAAYRVGQSAP